MYVRLKAALIGIGALGLGSSLQLLFGEPPTRLTFLAVGQGDCAVFQTAGATVLIDTGPKSEQFDAGERIVAPKLRALGARRIDLILLSHPDADHIGGLPALAKRFAIGKVALPARFRNDPATLSWLGRANVSPGTVWWVGQEERARIGGFDVRVSCPPPGDGAGDNSGSMFVRLSGARAGAVFSGDATMEPEAAMLHYASWQAQVLKVGHHGSKTSSSDAWLRAVGARWAVVSSGRNNRYGHPSPEALARLSASGAQVLRTDRGGDMTFVLGRNGFEKR